MLYFVTLLNFTGSGSYMSFSLFVKYFRCITDGKYQQAMGISIECRRLDKLKEAILSSDNVHATLAYCMNISHAFVNRREYRSEVRTYKNIVYLPHVLTYIFKTSNAISRKYRLHVTIFYFLIRS